MSPAFAGSLHIELPTYPQLALWATDMPLASPTGALPHGRASAPASLFDLFQNSIGVIAGDQRNVLVGAQFLQQWNELLRIR